MKTTIDLPEEVFRQAEQQAAQRGLEVSQFLSVAVSKAIQAALPLAPTTGRRRVDFPVIRARPDSPVLTKEAVERAQEAMLREEAESYAKSMRR